MYQHKDLLFYRLSEDQFSAIPLYENSVPAGFPSPAEDFMDLDLNLQEYLIPVSYTHLTLPTSVIV